MIFFGGICIIVMCVYNVNKAIVKRNCPFSNLF